MTRRPASITITSHPLCPFMHAWRIALAGAGVPHDVRRLEYDDVSRWGELLPAGAEIPWLTMDAATLWGTLPVLQWIEETVAGARLLPDEPAERVRARNRALLAVELLNTMRTVFTSRSVEQEHAATEALFTVLGRCESQAWSPRARIDWVLFAAASTILASRVKLMTDERWSTTPKTRALVVALAEEDVVVATRIDGYDDQFRAFYRAFGGTFEAGRER